MLIIVTIDSFACYMNNPSQLTVNITHLAVLYNKYFVNFALGATLFSRDFVQEVTIEACTLFGWCHATLMAGRLKVNKLLLLDKVCYCVFLKCHQLEQNMHLQLSYVALFDVLRLKRIEYAPDCPS